MSFYETTRRKTIGFARDARDQRPSVERSSLLLSPLLPPRRMRCSPRRPSQRRRWRRAPGSRRGKCPAGSACTSGSSGPRTGRCRARSTLPPSSTVDQVSILVGRKHIQTWSGLMQPSHPSTQSWKANRRKDGIIFFSCNEVRRGANFL